MLKLKHLLHPLGAAVALKTLLASHWDVKNVLPAALFVLGTIPDITCNASPMDLRRA